MYLWRASWGIFGLEKQNKNREQQRSRTEKKQRSKEAKKQVKEEKQQTKETKKHPSKKNKTEKTFHQIITIHEAYHYILSHLIILVG